MSQDVGKRFGWCGGVVWCGIGLIRALACDGLCWAPVLPA